MTPTSGSDKSGKSFNLKQQDFPLHLSAQRQNSLSRQSAPMVQQQQQQYQGSNGDVLKEKRSNDQMYESNKFSSIGVASSAMQPQYGVNRNMPWRTASRDSPLPKKTIIQAVALFIGGIVFLLLGIIGSLESDSSSTLAQMRITSLIIGALLFIPGFFYTRIAYLAWKKVPGFDFSQLPDD
ncbi:hypothetical protein MP228_007016 [Amoeboaphelidium protococcarum]|nr:hypothetical protein MP228_007016 [Amoeboaphelidium protococcarum]